MIRLLPLASLLAAGCCAAAVSVATFKQAMPPPGLYQIDTDGTIRMRDTGTSARQQTDGASGDVTATVAGPGGKARQDFKGDGPVRFCVPAHPAGTPVLPPNLGAAACKTLSTTGGADGIVHIAQCAGGRYKLTVRRLSENTWEFIDHADLAPTPGAPSVEALRPMMEQMAKHGTPEERAKAQQALAALPQQQAAMDAGRAQAMAALAKAQADAKTPQEAAAVAKAMQAMGQTGIHMQTDSRRVWTRIAEHCGS
ncbi:hypothetical protein [Rugamonas aquatica]|uniref:DUF4124 domain-containing protein n=1 Tax=Rugamonas aquatica TaxID=2743357 RepID=A0A6A7MZI3_9BURK|nr:hypothetical protein [Rugamonas aquatica]MQA38145.1 hypothetical protein [Rugamonas aquatica]